MVLHTRGRVGRRHFTKALSSLRTRGFLFVYAFFAKVGSYLSTSPSPFPSFSLSLLLSFSFSLCHLYPASYAFLSFDLSFTSVVFWGNPPD